MSFFKLVVFQLILFCFISCDIIRKNPEIDFLGPVLEVVNNEGRLEYTGRVINDSGKKIKNLKVRYIGKNKDGKIIEAVTIPIKGTQGSYILQGEIVDFQFTLRSKTKNLFDKKLTLDYIQ
tara:strand:- start:68 stop:430 length:363 start_codon:yes stop_codon:yes gene_type:complete